MHIAFLTPEFPHEDCTNSGGLGTSILNLGTQLVKEGHKVSVVIYGQEGSSFRSKANINLHFIEKNQFAIGGWYFYRKKLEKYVNNLIEKEEIDVVEAPDWTGITAFMKLKVPLVIRLHGSDAYFCHLEGRQQKLKNRFFESQALKAADHIISVSKYTAEVTTKIFELHKTISVIPNSIDPEKFIPSKNNICANQILYFGTIIRKKGVLELANIFNEVILRQPNAKLVLLGKDVIDILENRSTLELFMDLLSEKAKIAVSHIQEVDHSEIQKYLASANVVVLPSFAEALPMTWLEAMSMEKALVTSNVGWAPEIMTHKVTGFTEDPKDHNAYAGKIVLFLNDVEKAKKMGAAARLEILKKFSSSVVVKKNINLYREIISKNIKK